MPDMLLGGPVAPPQPPQPPTGGSTDEVPVATQTTAEPARSDGELASIPSRLYEDRVPSSESPSPMRLPGHGSAGPATPAKITRQATTVIQDRIMSLLGKRRSEEEEDTGLGKRTRPLQRTRVCLSISCSITSGTHVENPMPPSRAVKHVERVVYGTAAHSRPKSRACYVTCP